ncbi:MAG: hypothetical protein Q7Q73_09510 [Verrucomicrobiota bacterium JB024]|nr:hypothetical protein [Verrucomicrobiota bacterium JB024]
MLYQEGVMVPVVAIGLFAGLRPSEIQDLDPKNIKEDYIVVTGGKLRRKMNRRAPLPDRLKVWLTQYPFVGIPDGIVYKMTVLKEAEKWVQDIIRHTSISFQLERDQDEARTAFNNGTSRAMIERHYRDVVEDPKHVQAYWALTPESLKSISVELPAGQGIARGMIPIVTAAGSRAQPNDLTIHSWRTSCSPGYGRLRALREDQIH